MKRMILILLAIIFFNSCEESTFFDPTYFAEGFKGITYTFEDSPEAIKSDPSDWCYGSSMNKETIDTVILPGYFSFGPAYPNPTSGSTNIMFTLPVVMGIRIYVINKDYQTIDILVDRVLNAGVYRYEYSTNRLTPGIYRVVFESDKIYCTGDIWVKRRN
jgi:hypothetical protein